jgi:hypothetical protein
MTVFHPRLYVIYISGFSLVGLVRTAICAICFALKRKHHFREYSLQTSSMHCSVFGDVHDISSANEGAQALNIYVNRLID